MSINLKLKRLVRTSSSEQYALFDLNQIEPRGESSSKMNPGEDGTEPMTVGKFDLHYTGEGAYGTLLLWDENFRTMKLAQRQDFIYAMLNEIVQPMGVPNEYVIEFFAPDLQGYEVFHNVGLDGPSLDGIEDRQQTTGPQAAKPVYESPDNNTDIKTRSQGQ